ncbi:MAG TPA: hypothetical protein VMS08_05300 [Candidatus Saccharimonadia bacterium]|jgi:hypothetical protein|nr:hypothetical protein [Candidatus Saccharimonadia bacterium]
MKRNRVREAFDRLQKELIKAAHTKDSAGEQMISYNVAAVRLAQAYEPSVKEVREAADIVEQIRRNET